MKTDKDEDKKMLIYSFSELEAYALIASLANQLAAREKGVSCGIATFDCDGLHVLFGINCIE